MTEFSSKLRPQHADRRPDIPDGNDLRLVLSDIVVGTMFFRHYARLSEGKMDYINTANRLETVISPPFIKDNGTSWMRVKQSLGSGAIQSEVSLSDLGVLPYPDGRWTLNVPEIFTDDFRGYLRLAKLLGATDEAAIAYSLFEPQWHNNPALDPRLDLGSE